MGAPYTYTDPSAERYVEVGLETSMQSLATNLEAYAISGLKAVEKNDNGRRNALKKSIREKLKENLREYHSPAARRTLTLLSKGEVAGSKNAKMWWNKVDFEKKIVVAYGVDLVGWPLDSIFEDIGKVSASKLEQCHTALESGDCKWVKLSRTELQQRVSQSYELEKPPRKTRSDKNKRRKGACDDSSDSDSEGGSEGESRKRRRRSDSSDGHDNESHHIPRPRVCSAPTIDDSDME